jgi:ribose 5-phosphate isomerase A
MTQDEAKALVGKRAAEMVEDGMAVGLGTGTTSVMFIKALGERVRQGLKIRCVASSDASTALGRSLGMNVVSLVELPELDVYIDGADEVSAGAGVGLNLIKGGGGALLREKIVASSAKKFIVVADSTKVVKVLGAFPLPVEVIKMALPLVEKKLVDLGLRPVQRRNKDGSVYLTDENNYILDCGCGEIADPAKTAAEIRNVVGVVEHGLFLGMANLALIAGDGGVTELRA